MRLHDPRAELEQLIGERRERYAALSQMLGRNAAYIQQYIKRGVPAVLSERDRQALADYFGVPAQLFDPDAVGVVPRTSRAEHSSGAPASRRDFIAVPRLDVQASAGPGALAESEAKLGHYGFDRSWLQRLSEGSPDRLSIVRVSGDSMAPTLLDGDDILVEQITPGARVRDGVYVLQRDDALLVKRVALGRASGTFDVSSDNTAYPSWPNCTTEEVQVLGRVIWAARRFR